MRRSTRVHLAPGGIDLDAVRAAPPAAASADVLYVGRLIEHKGVGLLLDALALLRAEGTELTALIVGRGPQAAQLRAACTELGLDDLVTFRDDVETADEVYGLMKTARVFASPSTREGFGVSVLEALACGVPVVTTTIPRTWPGCWSRRAAPGSSASPMPRRWPPRSCAPPTTRTAPVTTACAGTTGTPSPTTCWRCTPGERRRASPRDRGASSCSSPRSRPPAGGAASRRPAAAVAGRSSTSPCSPTSPFEGVWAAMACATLALLLVPGLLLLEAAGLPRARMLRFPPYLPAASIVMLAAAAMLANFGGPALGVDAPLDGYPLLLSLDALLVASCLVASRRTPQPPVSAAGLLAALPRVRDAWPLLPVALVVAGALATPGDNRLALAGLVAAVATLAAGLLLAGRSPDAGRDRAVRCVADVRLLLHAARRDGLRLGHHRRVRDATEQLDERPLAAAASATTRTARC